MSTKEIKPIVKGVAVAVFPVAIGVTGFSPEWWIAMIVLNVGVNL